jgi:type IV pilus assembly protein PilB
LSEALETGAIVELLREEGVLSQEQIGFAERIRAKLTEERPLDVPLGSLLVELGFLDPQDLRVALDLQSQDPSGKAKLGEVLIEHHFVDERKLTELLASQLGFEILEPKLGDLDKKLLARTNASWMLQHEFVPIRSEGDAVVVAFADPMNTSHTQGAEGAFGARVIPAISPRSSILALISRLDTKTQPGGPVDEASVTDIVNGILDSAIVEAASDIHIEPLSDRLRVRFRKDGVLVLHKEYRQELLKPLSSRSTARSSSCACSTAAVKSPPSPRSGWRRTSWTDSSSTHSSDRAA